MIDLFEKICGSTFSPSDAVDSVITDTAALGKTKPRLREGVEVVTLTSASGEPFTVLQLPDGSSPVNIPRETYEVCLNLDGETTVHQAVDGALRNGVFPAGLPGHLYRLYEAGLLEEPEGLLSDCFRVRPEGPARETGANVLWGKEIPAPTFQAFANALIPLTSILASAYVFWMLWVVGLCGFVGYWQLVRTGDTVLLAAGPLALWCKLLGIWVFANFGQWLRAAACGPPKPGKLRLKWRLYFGLPFLSVDEGGLKTRPWLEALRRRLSGALFLWVIGTLGALAIWLSEFSRLDELYVIVSSASFLIGFLHLSPWWKSPLRDSVRQAMPEIEYPWTCWNFLWKGIWKALFGNQPLGKQGIGLVVGSLYLLGWTLVACRLATFMLRNIALQLYLDSSKAGSPAHAMILKVAAVAFALVAVFVLVNVVLLFVFRAFRGLGGLPVWDVHRNLFLTFLFVGIVLGLFPVFLPEPSAEVAHWIGFFLLYLLLGSFFAFALKPNLRTYFSSAFMILTIWSFASAISMLREALLGELQLEGAVHYVRWPLFFPVAALFLNVDLILRNRGKYVSLWPAAIASLVIIELRRGMTPGHWYFAVLFGIAAILMLAWGSIEVGGWYRRLTYYFAAVLFMLTLAAICFTFMDRTHFRSLNLFPGTLGLSLLLLVPFTYRLLLERKPKVPSPPAQDLPGSNRELLLQAVNQFWSTVQGRIAFIAGERITLAASSSASKTSPNLQFGISEVAIEGKPASDMEELSEDLDRCLLEASRTWVAACGIQGVANAALVAFQRLDWERRSIFSEYLLRPGGWWTSLLPKGVVQTRVDPEFFFKNKLVFSQLTPDQQRLALSKVNLRHFSPGETVVRQGESSGQLFFIAEGKAEVATSDILAGPRKTVLHRDDHFGQTAFLTGNPQTATVRALEDLLVFSIDRADVPDLIPEILKLIPSGIGEKKIDRLSKIPLFRALSPTEIELLAERAHTVEFPAGATIIQQGESEGDFYVVDEGSVEVTRDGEKLATLGAGEYFGEMALLLAVPRTATVTASTLTRCIQVSCEEFKRLLSSTTFHGQIAHVAERRA